MLNVIDDVLSVAGDEPSLTPTVLSTDKRAAVLTKTSRRDFYRGQLESAVDSRDRWKLT